MEAGEPFVTERTYAAPIAIVWKAITEETAVRQWFVNFSGFKPEVGFEFTYETIDKGKALLLLFKITEVVQGSKLSYSWRYQGYEGCLFVTMELFEEGQLTRVKLTHAGLETFPVHPVFAKENYVQGWALFIGKSLAEFLEKK